MTRKHRLQAVELAPRGIRVNAINPLGRFTTPEDMGNAAAFLCSEEAGMITGIFMEVDGGRCI